MGNDELWKSIARWVARYLFYLICEEDDAMKKSLFFFLCALFSLAHADLISIDFEDGTHTEVIDDFYANLGLNFVNAEWHDHGNLAGGEGLGLLSQREPFGSLIPPEDPIVGLFSGNVSFVTITAMDVGSKDARIDVFDVNNNLIGSDNIVGSGSGVGDFGDLTVTAVGIRRFELYQPFQLPSTETGDGIVLDNLSFNISLVPEPSSILLISFAFALLLPFRKK